MALCCQHFAVVLVLLPAVLVAGKLYLMPNFDPALGEKLNAEYWKERGISGLKEKFQQLHNAGFRWKGQKAKNIILFIGDGFGVPTAAAVRKYKQDTTKANFYENTLIWDSFPFAGYSKNYQLDAVVPDSAGTATAYLTGIKTRYGFIGVDGSADLKCESKKGFVTSLAHWAEAAGKDAGFVTTTSVTHASPSPLYAHTPAPLRSYQCNTTAYKPYYAISHPKCTDIAQQFVTNARHLKVALGGGQKNFLPEGQGIRSDGRDLVEEWKKDRSAGGKKAVYVTSFGELQSVPKDVDYVLGMFNDSHLDYYDNQPSPSQPRLADMAEAAVKILGENPNGFFLFVEGGKIDHGHHKGSARYALSEGLELDVAVSRVLNMVDLSETLIVVSADHSHVFSYGGALLHSDNILSNSLQLANDNRTYTSLMYANGPGARLEGPNAPYEGVRPNESNAEVTARGYLQQAMVPLNSETHGAEDVPVFATGVYSELLTGVFEQSHIAWTLACAAGLEPHDPVTSKRLAAICPPYAFASSAISTPTANIHMFWCICLLVFCKVYHF